MNIDTAPVANRDEDEDASCDDCGGGTYVLYDGEKVCDACGYLSGSGHRGGEEAPDEWAEWQEHRRNHDDYEGWYGDDRIKMVGGFGRAYDYGADIEETLLAD